MAIRRDKWHHRLFGTVDDRRLWRDVALRKLGLARTHAPKALAGRNDLLLPNVVRGLAADILLQQRQLTFAQIGAFDGASDDDLTGLLELDNVRGVLVEPQPEPFAKLQARFANSRNVQLFNVAIADCASDRMLYRPRSGASRLASFDRGNLLRHDIKAEEIEAQTVRCLPLDRVISEAAFDQLDVLQIDAEGYDLAVLATLDLERWMPALIRFEYLHIQSRELDACLDGLARQGYRFLVQQRDLVALRGSEVSQMVA